MPLFVITLAVLCAVAVAVPRGSDRAQSDAAKTYAGTCAMCHGKAGAGDGAAAAAFNPKPTDFTTTEFQKGRTDEQIAAAIKDGKGAMAGFKSQLTAAQIKDLVAYLRSLGPQ
jgi:mono/diheme cytochrome c family protein